MIHDLRSKIPNSNPQATPAAVSAISLIDALIADLPPLGSQWPADKRAKWLRMTASVFDHLYENGEHVIRIDVEPRAGASAT